MEIQKKFENLLSKFADHLSRWILLAMGSDHCLVIRKTEFAEAVSVLK